MELRRACISARSRNLGLFAGTLDAQLAHATLKRRALHAQELRCATVALHAPTRDLEDPENVFPLGLVERERRGGRRHAVRFGYGNPQLATRCEDHGTFDCIA